MEKTSKKISTKELVLYAIFIGIILLLGLTPIGYIVIVPGSLSITLVHIPVIIGAVLFGVKAGALFGFFFGLTSLINAFLKPAGMSALVLGADSGFGIYNLIMIIFIIFLPRICVGVFSALISKAFKRGSVPGLVVTSLTGTLTNTILFLGMFYVLGAQMLMSYLNKESTTAVLVYFLGVAGTNGVVEAIASAFICTAVLKAIMSYVPQFKNK